MSEPVCTVIIPTFNHGKYIERSIQCALDQTYPNVEIIVVDDGSTDDTPERVEKFGDSVIYIRKENTGRGDNRNRAIERSSGTYIQFLDADDTIAPTKLAVQIPILESDESLTVVYSDCACTDPDGEDIANASYPLRDDEDPVPILLGRTLSGIHSAITRRNAIIDVGMFDPHPLAQEDWDLWLKLALHGYRYRYVPGDLAMYDQQGSTTVVNAPLMYKRMKHMLGKYQTDPLFLKLDQRLQNHFIAQQNLQLATRSYNNRWWSAARAHIRAAVGSDRSVMPPDSWSWVPKTYLHQIMDRLRGRQSEVIS